MKHVRVCLVCIRACVYTCTCMCTFRVLCIHSSLVLRPHPLPYRLQYKEREGLASLGELIT